jgi:DNA-binding NtrC family response regulator
MSNPDADRDLRAQLRSHETALILAALRACGWNQTEAARTLRIPRRTLIYRMKNLGITRLGYAADREGAR